MMTFGDLTARYPRSGKNRASTGLIPIEEFNANEKEIRAAMREEITRRQEYTNLNYKIWAAYRGPRVSNSGTSFSQTRRRDAQGVRMYFIYTL